MPKSKQTIHQPSLFPERPIPKMPEGYYFSSLNPNLQNFVGEHATHYNPASDNYDIEAFDNPIKIKNRRDPINDLHIYWSKKPYQAIQHYLRHYTRVGDLILDPFCGSGTTAIAALLNNRKVVAIDLSPASTFITKHYCTPLDPYTITTAFSALEKKVADKLLWLNETVCDRCDGKALTASVVYSAVYQCNRCLEQIPLFDCVAITNKLPDGKIKRLSACPNCYKKGIVEEINVKKNLKLDEIPVEVNFKCLAGCKQKRQSRKHNDKNKKKREYFYKYDLTKIRDIEKRNIPYWYPNNRMLNTNDEQKIWGLLWRPYHGDIVCVDQFFTHRSLWALSLIFSEINNLESGKDALTFAFSGCLYNATKMYRHREKGGGPQSGNYYMPPVYKEVRVWTLFEQKIKNLIKADKIWRQLSGELAVCISTQSATNISNVQENSIDYIFTDPPYAEKVQYGELNYFWESWLGFDTQWLENEIIVNEVRGIDEIEWANRLKLAFKECFRVLKPGRWLSLCYHGSESNWQQVQDITAEIGFIPEIADRTQFIDTGQKSYHQLMDKKITKRDLVINLRKPRSGELNRQLTLFGDEDPTTFTQKARAIITEVLEKHPGSFADRLYDELVSRMVRKGEFERHNFDEILRSVAEDVDGRWYLLETADQVDEAESRKETEAAAHLETFIHQYLQENPGKIGVHYSDLFEQYLPIGDKPRRSVLELIPEFFFKTEDGTWRLPANEEERTQKEALRTSGTLRRIKRFANVLLESVPPHERDVPANTATAADWIRQCRRAGLYEQGRALYEKGGFTFDGLTEEDQMEVEEDYQVCARRS